MFFELSKILWLVFEPSSLMLLAVAFGLYQWWRGNRQGWRFWLFGGLAALALATLTPIYEVLFVPLEERFPRADLSKGDVAGIIVLGGTMAGEYPDDWDRVTQSDSGERLTEAVALAQRLPKAHIVFSGGSASLLISAVPEATIAGRMLVAHGIEASQLTLEDKSRTTAENARYSKTLLQPRPNERWLLLTSAWHMPRAIGSFRAAGFPVEAWPVDYRSNGPFDPLRLHSGLPEGLEELDFAAKEYVGLLAYRLTGRTDELFPGPLTTTPP